MATAKLIRWVFLFAPVLTLSANVRSYHEGQPAPYQITAKRPTDKIQTRQENGATVFDVKSPFGISSATITRLSDDWPKKVVLRLHLKGLENFRVASGTGSLHAAASVENGKLGVRQWKDGKENAPVTEQSEYWMKFRIFDDDKPAQKVPLEKGVFEITLPPAFFKSNPKSISVDWIDFYR